MKWLVFLLTIMIVLVSGTIAVARRQALPQVMTRLNLTECELPCWSGITLGTSRLKDLSPQLTARFNDAAEYTVDDQQSSLMEDFSIHDNRTQHRVMVETYANSPESDIEYLWLILARSNTGNSACPW